MLGHTLSGQTLICRVSSRLCAIPLEAAVKTLRPLPAQPVAGAPEFVRGLALIRGAAVPVVDLGRLLGGTATSAGRFVTVRLGADRRVALAVDEVVGVRTLAPDSVAELPPLVHAAAGDAVEAGILDAELLLVLRQTLLVSLDALPGLEARS